VKRHPERDVAAVLAGFTELVFDDNFEANFSGATPRAYAAINGAIEACPVELKPHE
jgi:hypothetical protein